MPGNLVYSDYSSVVTALTTELNGLTSSNVSALSAEQDNSTNKHYYADVAVSLSTINVTTSTAVIYVYLVPSLDGTNYPEFDVGTTTPGNNNLNYLVGLIRIKASNASHLGVLRQIPLPPGKYKIAIRNGTGVALNASNNTVTFRTYTEAFT